MTAIGLLVLLSALCGAGALILVGLTHSVLLGLALHIVAVIGLTARWMFGCGSLRSWFRSSSARIAVLNPVLGTCVSRQD